MKNNNVHEERVQAGFIMPKYTRYIKTWCVILKGTPVKEFAKKKQASDWLKKHGYDVIQ